MSQAVQTGYELLNKIGGDVYRAYQPSLNRFVAIKVIKQHLADDPAFMERFFGEARLSASLNHPNIAHVYEVGEHAGRPYMVMELLEGEPLEEAIRRGPLGEAAVVTVAKQVLAGLSRAYERGTVAHRDIKPSNVFLCTDGTVKVMDFGIAKAAEGSHLTQVGTVLGTAAYMSPEQSDGLPVDARSDLYSLGVVLYEMLTGRLPFDADSAPAFARMHRSAPPPPLPSTVSPDLRAVIERALSKDQAQRFGSAREMLAALDGQPAVSGYSATGNSAVSGEQEIGPGEALRGWNWGAFSFGWIWLFAHKARIAALTLLIVPTILVNSFNYFIDYSGRAHLHVLDFSVILPPYIALHWWNRYDVMNHGFSIRAMSPPYTAVFWSNGDGATVSRTPLQSFFLPPWGTSGISTWLFGFQRLFQWLLQLGVMIYLGTQGNRIAWRSGRFRTVAEMKGCENAWAKWGIGFFIVFLIIESLSVIYPQQQYTNQPVSSTPVSPKPSKADPLVADAYQLLHHEVHKETDAAMKARKAITMDSNCADAHAMLALALTVQSANNKQNTLPPDEALSEVHRALELNPNCALAFAVEGEIDYVEWQIDYTKNDHSKADADSSKADAELQMAVKLDTQHTYDGFIYLIYGAIPSTQVGSSDEESITRNPWLLTPLPMLPIAAYNGLAISERFQGRFAEAEADDTKAISRAASTVGITATDLAPLYQELGATQWHLGKTGSAINNFKRAVQDAPTAQNYTYLVGVLSLQIQADQQASKTAEMAHYTQLYNTESQKAHGAGITDKDMHDLWDRVARLNLFGPTLPVVK